MPEKNQQTRKQRYKNKGRTNLVMQLAAGLGGLLVLVLVFQFLLGNTGHNKDQTQAAAGNSKKDGPSLIIQNETSSSAEAADSDAEEDDEDEEDEDREDESEEDKKKEEKKEKEEKKRKKHKKEEIREVDSNDPNVIKAMTGDWKPIGTSQSEPHTINYDDGSQDRLEIKTAVSQATGVAEEDMIENWIGNNGEQKVTSTITQTSTGKIYKTYLSWEAGKGWQVTRVEELRQVIR